MVNTLRPPPEVVASWPLPNYVDPEERGPGLVYCAIILASFGVLIVSARIYSRVFITRAPGVDDLLIFVGMLLGIALTVLVSIGNLRFHSGRHIWDVQPSTAPGHRLNIWVSQWCYLTATSCVKISVLLFYRRLSVTFSRGFWWATWIGIWYNILQTVSFCLALLLLCRPLEAYWLSFDRTWALEHQGKFECVREDMSLTMSTVVSVIGDFYAAVLPSVLIMGLNMTPQKKAAVGALFAVGYLVVGLGIGRCIMLNRVVMHDYDYTWTLWSMWIWSLCELWIGLLAASAPALKPFLKQFIVDPLSSAISNTARNSQGQKKGRSDMPADSTRRPARSWNWLSPMLPMSPRGRGEAVVLDDSASSTQLKSNVGVDLELQRTNSPDSTRSFPYSPYVEVSARPHQFTMDNCTEEISATIDSRLAGDTEWQVKSGPTHSARCWSPASVPVQVKSMSHQTGSEEEHQNLEEVMVGGRFSTPLPMVAENARQAARRKDAGTTLVDVDSDAEWHVRERQKRLSNRNRKWDWR